MKRTIICTLLCATLAQAKASQETIKSAGITGGLIIQVGCGEPKTLTALYHGDSFLIQALDRDKTNIQKARKHITDSKLYGPVTAELLVGNTLPYVNNCANAVVIENASYNIEKTEIERVLTPRGILIRNGKCVFQKPVPGNIDEWTHSQYDAAGNAVSTDELVGPPQSVQWISDPRWTRHHEAISSFHAMVTSGGRIFYIMDDGPQVSLFLPANWKITARDAFNGKLLWEHKLDKWMSQLHGYKSGPAIVTRLLVASPDHLFTTLELQGPLSVLDTATGKVLKTYAETKGTEEILHTDGTVYALVNDHPETLERKTIPEKSKRRAKGFVGAWVGDRKEICAIDVAEDNIIWKKEYPVAPMTLTANANGVYFHNGERLIKLDPTTGEEKWQSEDVPMVGIVPINATPTIVAYKDVLLINAGAGSNRDKLKVDRRSSDNNWKIFRRLSALSAESGKKLWEADMPAHGYEAPKDILIADGLVWNGEILGEKHSGTFKGRDPMTGEVKKEFSPNWDIYWFHQRCYRSRATDRFLIPSRTGTELISPDCGYVSINHWIRGACLYGTVPANGLLYATPHPCGCYMEGAVHGFHAVASQSPTRTKSQPVPDSKRLITGDKTIALKEIATDKADWPCYRRDNERSSYAETVVPAELNEKWKTPVGTKLSSITVADDTLFVSDIDTHTIHALNARTGKQKWQFIAGGRVDSPPTYYKGRAIFGSHDGYVYCLNADNGELIWKYLAAPSLRNIVSRERVESAWPLHGSVLVRDNKIYCVAGRSMFLDGGIRMLILDANTGKKLSENVMNEINPHTEENIQLKVVKNTMPVANPDILSCDETYLYMKSQRFDFEGKRHHIESSSIHLKEQYGEGAHLFCASDMLDDTGFHRTHMIYGKSYVGGHALNHLAPKFAPGGRMLSFDNDFVYGFARQPHYHRWTKNLKFHIFAADKHKQNSDIYRGRAKETPEQILNCTNVKYDWSIMDPDLYVTGMVLTDSDKTGNKTLFVAGMPAMNNDDTLEALEKWKGFEGGIVWSISAGSGKKLNRISIESPTVFDGMAAANGGLYLALKNGKVLCLGK